MLDEYPLTGDFWGNFKATFFFAKTFITVFLLQKILANHEA